MRLRVPLLSRRARVASLSGLALLGALAPIRLATAHAAQADLPTLVLTGPIVMEGDEGNAGDPSIATFARVSAVLSRPSATPVTFNVNMADGSAKAGEDYVALPKNAAFTIPAGETSAVIAIRIVPDRKAEENENLTVSASNVVGARYGGPSGVTILDDDKQPNPSGLPTLSIGNERTYEGDAGTHLAHLTITLSKPSDVPVVVTYRMKPGTVGKSSVPAATTGEDYQDLTGTLTIHPGHLVWFVEIPIKGDTANEPEETFTVELFDAQGATIRKGAGTVWIRDDLEGRPKN